MAHWVRQRLQIVNQKNILRQSLHAKNTLDGFCIKIKYLVCESLDYRTESGRLSHIVSWSRCKSTSIDMQHCIRGLILEVPSGFQSRSKVLIKHSTKLIKIIWQPSTLHFRVSQRSPFRDVPQLCLWWWNKSIDSNLQDIWKSRCYLSKVSDGGAM